MHMPKRTDMPDFEGEPIYICPKCGGTMMKWTAAGLPEMLIDRCQLCGGVFLDKGELEKIRKHDCGLYQFLLEDDGSEE